MFPIRGKSLDLLHEWEPSENFLLRVGLLPLRKTVNRLLFWMVIQFTTGVALVRIRGVSPSLSSLSL